MPATVDYYFDFGSPAAHIGYFEIKRIAAAASATLKLQPMLLGGVFKATGNHTPMQVPAKGTWMVADLSDYARRYGVPFAMNPHFILNTMMSMRGACVAETREELPAYCDALFMAVWRDGLDVSDESIYADVLSRAGFDAPAYQAGVIQPAIKHALKQATEAAVARGVFGAPTIFLGNQMWFGQDRLFLVEQALSGDGVH